MHEVLFRAKRKDNGEWIYGFFWKDIWGDGESCYILCDGESYPVIPNTRGEYIGLTDKNGVKIFEGDIVSMPAYGRGKLISAVYFKGGKFAVDGSNYSFKDIHPKSIEVVGNIHDGLDLLEDG